MTLWVVYIFLLSIGASFVQRTVGFGFGIFIMTALPWLMPSYGQSDGIVRTVGDDNVSRYRLQNAPIPAMA